jgi:hypothetical protein
LLERVQDGGQAVITTAELGVFPEPFLGHVKVWQVAAGRVVKPQA